MNCYAMKQAHRFSGPGAPYEGLTKQTKAGPQWTGAIRTVEDALDSPVLELAGVVDERAALAAHARALAGLGPGARPPAGLAEQGVGLLVELARLPGIRVPLGQYVEDVLAAPPTWSTGYNRFDPTNPSIIDLFDFGADGTTNGMPDGSVPVTLATLKPTDNLSTLVARVGTYPKLAAS